MFSGVQHKLLSSIYFRNRDVILSPNFRDSFFCEKGEGRNKKSTMFMFLFISMIIERNFQNTAAVIEKYGTFLVGAVT